MESRKKTKPRQKKEPQRKPWETYEQIAAYLLNRLAKEFGLGLKSVEGKQKVKGQRTSWVIDAKGVAEDGKGFFIVECRRYTSKKSKQNQEQAGALAFSIIDTRAAGGIIVSPFGVQEGAAKIAAAENILVVTGDNKRGYAGLKLAEANLV
jgi:hypothetical protein